jgi:hypothetical protein
MIQAGGPQIPHYAYSLLRRDTPGLRLPRAEQRAGAEALLNTLRIDTGCGGGAASKAHSRALVAAAVMAAGCVGVDVEFHAPGRRIEAIAHYLMEADAPDVSAAYRVFTYYEAYFKAVGEFPSPAAMRAVAWNTEPDYVVDGMCVLHRLIENDFTLALVWSQTGLAVRQQLPKHAERRL